MEIDKQRLVDLFLLARKSNSDVLFDLGLDMAGLPADTTVESGAEGFCRDSWILIFQELRKNHRPSVESFVDQLIKDAKEFKIAV